MVAETMMLINPKRRSAGRKKPRSAAQKAATKRLVAHNRARRTPAKRKSNPIKHRRPTTHHAVAAAPRRRRARRHNPISLNKPLAMLMPALYGAGGALAINAAMNYLPIPAMLTTGKIRYATKFGLALLLGTFGKKLLGAKAEKMAEGAMIVTMAEAMKDIVGGATGLQLGDSDGISYISPAQLAAYTDGGSQFAAYLNGDESANDFDSGVNLTPQGAPNFDYTYG